MIEQDVSKRHDVHSYAWHVHEAKKKGGRRKTSRLYVRVETTSNTCFVLFYLGQQSHLFRFVQRTKFTLHQALNQHFVVEVCACHGVIQIKIYIIVLYHKNTISY